jgi:hypothetical protein
MRETTVKWALLPVTDENGVRPGFGTSVTRKCSQCGKDGAEIEAYYGEASAPRYTMADQSWPRSYGRRHNQQLLAVSRRVQLDCQFVQRAANSRAIRAGDLMIH